MATDAPFCTSTPHKPMALTEHLIPAYPILSLKGALREILLIGLGVVFLAVLSKLRVPLWPSPVPLTFGPFAVVVMAGCYHQRTSLLTILAWVLVGALGLSVFAGDKAGLSYIMGATGGYLFGYACAVLYLGQSLVVRGAYASLPALIGHITVAYVLIYTPGLVWLHHFINGNALYDATVYESAWQQTLAWGLNPYIIGDIMKLLLAALVLYGVYQARPLK